MVDREERAAQAARHNALMKGAFATETKESAEEARIYEEGQARDIAVGDPRFEATETLVTTAFIPDALHRYAKGRAVVVDPASFTRPGGAYEDGAFGPEQVICSESNLYQILCGLKEAYYDKNRDYRRGQLCTDRAAYVPRVVFPRDGALRRADVTVMAEPLRVRALENRRSERECDAALAGRIDALMRIAVHNECETLICGAFACGRLGYDSRHVASLFRAWIDEHPGAIGRVVFAVPRACFDAFDALFGTPQQEEPSAPVVVAEEDGVFDASAIELPEGVTLRF